jgi:hypothetical protein
VERLATRLEGTHHHPVGFEHPVSSMPDAPRHTCGQEEMQGSTDIPHEGF